ncbi:MAG: MFS transporter, partial [Dehalococcoidia bacterium]
MLLLMGAMQMQMVVRGYLTYDLTSSPALLGLVSAGFALPMLTLSLFGGAIADRLERKQIIQLGQAAAGAIAVFVAVSITTNFISWVHLLVASMLQGAVFSFMMPARQAIIPQIVGQELLTNAMALNAMGMSASTLLAPTVAGTLYALLGPENVYYIVAGMCLGSVLLTGLVPKLPSSSPGRRATMLRDIGAGLSYIKRSPVVMVLLLIGLFTAVLAMPFRFLLPVFVVDIYGRGPEAMGLLVSLIGLGSVVGSVVIAALGNWNRGQMLLLGTFITGMALLLVALTAYV